MYLWVFLGAPVSEAALSLSDWSTLFQIKGWEWGFWQPATDEETHTKTDSCGTAWDPIIEQQFSQTSFYRMQISWVFVNDLKLCLQILKLHFLSFFHFIQILTDNLHTRDEENVVIRFIYLQIVL